VELGWLAFVALQNPGTRDVLVAQEDERHVIGTSLKVRIVTLGSYAVLAWIECEDGPRHRRQDHEHDRQRPNN
jgi:hypothetical protein